MSIMKKLPNGNWINSNIVTAIQLSKATPPITTIYGKKEPGCTNGEVYQENGDSRDKLAEIFNN